MRQCFQRPALGGGEMGEGAQKVKTFSYEIIKFWDVMYSMVTIFNNMYCIFENC